VSFIVSTPYVLWNKRHADRSHRPIMAALR
jgi:hypothetical protein